MKDYSTSAEERNEFILSYKIKGGEICLRLPRKRGFINLFKKNFRPIPYIEENKQKVIKKMEEQVKRAGSEKIFFGFARDFHRDGGNVLGHGYDVYENEVQWSLIIGFIGLIIFGPLAYLEIGLAGSINIFTLGLISTVVLLGLSISDIVLDMLTKKDLEKSKFFLENEEEINANLNKPNVLLNVSRKTVAKVEEVKASGKPFNIYDIDKLPLKDLKQLKANIDRIMLFGFDEEPTTIEQGFQKTKQ